MAHALVAGRMGKAKSYDIDDEFWATLKGTIADVQPAVDDEEEDNPADAPIASDKCILYRLSDASGKMTFKKEKEGKLAKKDLDSSGEGRARPARARAAAPN